MWWLRSGSFDIDNDCFYDIGDVNQDHYLDVIDIVIIVGFIIGNVELLDEQLELADSNGDGSIDVLDVIMLVNLILFGEYNTNADLNEDGDINILDIVIYRNIILGN